MSAHGGSNSWNLSPSAIAGERQKAASGPLWPACGRPGPARRSSSGPHFACGAGAPPEVPGGGATFGFPVLGAGFLMVGSTSFG